MALTPMDIHSKEFAHALRGYDVGEVDAFLEEVRLELDRAQRAAAEYARRAEAAEAKAASYVGMENTINNAFISAQQSADAIRAAAEAEGLSLREAARSEGERVYREAEAKARDIIREALADRERITAEADRLQASEDEFRARYIALLDHFYAEAKKKEFVGETIEEIASEPVAAAAVVEAADEPVAVVEPVDVPEAPEADTVVEQRVDVPESVVVPVSAPEPVSSDEDVEVGEGMPSVDPFAPRTAPVEDAEDDFGPDPFAPSPSAGIAELGEVEDDFEIEEID